MKQALFFFAFIFIGFRSFGQSGGYTALVDSVLKKAKEVSLYSSTTNWDSLNNAVHLKAKDANSLSALKPAFETLLNGLRDHHGKIINAKNYNYIAWFTDNKKRRYFDNREFDNETWKVVNDTSLKFSYKLLEKKIGYLKIVGIAPNADVEKEAKRIREAVVSLSKQKIEKWIIDLRFNTGGNMHPMMAGVAPLLGDGLVGGLVNLQNEKIFDWEVKNSNFIYGGYQALTLPNDNLKKEQKIAVLTSRWTVSSGEIVATSLKGRPNTKFFGETTGGYTTNDGWDVINNEVILVISTGIYADRNDVIYEKNIPIDVEIPFEVEKNTYKDKCIIEAIRWLNHK